MNVAVISLKDIFKYLIKFSSIFIVIFGLAKINNINKENFKYKINVQEYSLLQCIEYSIPFFKTSKSEVDNKNFSIALLEISLGKLKMKSNSEENHEIEKKDNETKLEIKKDSKITIGTNVSTEKVEEKNIATSFTDVYNSVEIKNGTYYPLTEDILYPNPDIINKKEVVIFHTHTSESYTPSNEYNYEMTGNYRTTDLNYSVARVGTELAECLTEKGFNIIHDTTYHDYPAYSGSYTRSLDTVSEILKNNSSQIVFDLHRDAIGNLQDYGPTVKIDGKYVAQLMFVIGTDAGGLEHPNWIQNLKLAIKIQETANEMYPGLFRPISLTNSRYNQHTAPGASIIEVGATGNTLEQCLLSMQCLANVLEKALE